jgi:hypothetical protein
MNKWPWDATKVATIWLRRLRELMKEAVQTEHDRLQAERPKSVGRQRNCRDRCLSLDDSVHTKRRDEKWKGCSGITPTRRNG